MKFRFKKIITAISLTAVLLLQCLMPAFAAEVDQTVKFSIDAITAEKGEIITLPIKISSTKGIALAGVTFSVDYKGNSLSYVEGSGNTTAPQLEGATVYNNTAAHRVTFAWGAERTVSLSASTVLCRLQFRVLDTAEANANVTLKISEAYTITAGNALADFKVENSTVTGVVTIGNASGAVTAVINKIDAIGKVEYTPESLEKILDAASAYAVLNAAQKAQVTNYQKLLDAQLEYERFKIEAEESVVSAEISKFLADHAYALTLTTETVKIADENAVLDALAAFKALSDNAKYKIFKYNTLLKNLREQIAALKKAAAEEEAARQEEARLRAEAKAYAEQFKKDKAPFLNMKPEDLLTDHYTGLNDAIENLNMLAELNPYVNEYLSAERIILTSLMEIVQELIKNSGNNEVSPEQMEADTFRNNFSYVLSLTEDTITVDDGLEVRLALAVYEMLDPAVQALLTKESSLLGGLLTAVENLELLQGADSEDPNDNDDPDPIIDNPDPQPNSNNQIARPAGISNLTMRFANRQMGAVVWVLLLLAVLALLVFGALQVFYHCFCKKKNSGDPGAEAAGEVVGI